MHCPLMAVFGTMNRGTGQGPPNRLYSLYVGLTVTTVTVSTMSELSLRSS